MVLEISGAVAEGRVDHALDLVEEAVASRVIGVFVVDLVADPYFDPIRDDPRYREILREVGLAEHWPAGAAARG